MYIAALDQGTTSTRCMIFDRQARVVGSQQMEHAQIYPQPGWVEHDPVEIWRNTLTVLRRAMAKSAVQTTQLAAIGVTNQRETTVVWNRLSGRPYCNAIVWQDTRTDKIVDELARNGGRNRFRARTGLPLSTYFSGPKLKWILEEVPGVREAAERGEAIFGTIDSWLIWNLTGGVNGGAHVTDVTNASRTQLMNLETLEWEQEILATLEIPRQMLPLIQPSSASAGYGYFDKVPVCGDLGDQQAALVGQTCFGVGEAKNTYGTGCFMLLNTGRVAVQSQHGLLTTVAYQLDREAPVYALEGSIAITGALVQWLRDNLGLFEFFHQIEESALAVPDSGGIYIVPAFSGLYAPYWQADARGVIVGLTRFINKNHFCRAALEATAYQTRDIFEAMAKDSDIKLTSLKVDGGMVGNELLMQFQSDILNVNVIRPSVAETTALGAAYAAGLAVGFWSGLDELRSNWSCDKKWIPNMDDEVRDRLYRGWTRAVQRSMNWLE